MNEEFPKQYPLYKTINKNNIKVSYSCMPNIKQTINAHNNTILEKQKQQNTTPRKNCNCREKESCPLKGNCQESKVIYQATVETIPKTSLSEGLLKLRYANHKSSFKNKEKANQTKISKYIWQLTNKNIKHNISWKILKKAKQYNTITNKCNLCLWECFLFYKT